MLTHILRALRLPVCGLRQRPVQQATAKGRRELPPYLGLDIPLRPHNMGSSLLRSTLHTFHSSPLQHLIVDIIRLYIAFHQSETDEGADLYYFRVTSMASLMKTSVYLAETVISDLFIVRLYSQFFALCTDLVLPLVISVLYSMEREYPRHHSPSHSIYRRYRYASPSSPTQRHTERHLLQGPGSRQSIPCRS